MICAMCDKGTLKNVREPYIFHGIDLGTYPGEKCDFCGELWTSGASMRKIEKVAKAKGVWGLGRSTKVTRTGNSLAIRIPKALVDHLKLKEGKNAFIHPESKKLVIEFS